MMTVSVVAVADIGLATAALACLFQGLRSARREARGRAMSIQRLCSTPTLASTASLLCFLFPINYPHNVAFWMLAIAIGLVVGAVRGIFVSLQVDWEWKLIRTWQTGDGQNAMRLLSVAGVLELLTIWASPGAPWRALLAGGMASCAAFLVGRVVVVWIRARAESHMELRSTRLEREESGAEQEAWAWAGRSAGVAVLLLPDFTLVMETSSDLPRTEDASDILKDGFDIRPPEMPALATGFARSFPRDARGRFAPASESAPTS